MVERELDELRCRAGPGVVLAVKNPLRLRNQRQAPASSVPWLSSGVAGIGAASVLADLGHEVPTALLPRLLTSMGGSAAALGPIEGISDGLAGLMRLLGGALADDPTRRRGVAVGGYTSTAVLTSLTGAVGSVWQVGILRAGGWAARGLRVPARNALLADAVPREAYGRAYGFERAMDNLGAIGGPLLALGLVAAFSVRSAILLSVIPGLLAAGAIVYAIRHIPHAPVAERQPLRLHISPVMEGRLGRLMLAVGAFEFGNVAATLLILRATELLAPRQGQDQASQVALILYLAYNWRRPPRAFSRGEQPTESVRLRFLRQEPGPPSPLTCCLPPGVQEFYCWACPSFSQASGSAASKPLSMRGSQPSPAQTSEAQPSGFSPRSRASGILRQVGLPGSCGPSFRRVSPSST